MNNDRNLRVLVASAALILSLIGLSGCGSDNRPPDPVGAKKADETRQSMIDKIPNLTPEQKAIMKSHMGGPSVPNPADAAKAAAGSGSGSNRRR